MIKKLSRTLLDTWDEDPDLAGGLLVTLTERESDEVEVRRTGEARAPSAEELRAAMTEAAERHEQAWPCPSGGYGYAIRHGGYRLGVCILFPSQAGPPAPRWAENVSTFAAQIGPLFEAGPGETPPLTSFLEVIAEPGPLAASNGRKPHWEESRSRVEMPVREDLTDYLLLDRLPLF